MKEFFRIACVLLLRLLIVVALSGVAMHAWYATAVANTSQAIPIAAAILVICVFVYYLTVRIAGRRLRLVRDSIIVTALLVGTWIFATNMILISNRSMMIRTMRDMNTIGIAIQAYAADHNSYPQVQTLDELTKQLVPAYIPEMRQKDGWRFPLRYEVDGQTLSGNYYLGSSGAGGTWEKSRLADYAPRRTESMSDDIIFHNGQFIASPMQ